MALPLALSPRRPASSLIMWSSHRAIHQVCQWARSLGMLTGWASSSVGEFTDLHWTRCVRLEVVVSRSGGTSKAGSSSRFTRKKAIVAKLRACNGCSVSNIYNAWGAYDARRRGAHGYR